MLFGFLKLASASSFISYSGQYQNKYSILSASSNEVYNVRRVGKKVLHNFFAFVEFKLKVKPGYTLGKNAIVTCNGKKHPFFLNKKGFFQQKQITIRNESIHSTTIKLKYRVCSQDKKQCQIISDKLSIKRSTNYVIKNGRVTYQRGPKKLIIKKL